MIKNFLQDATEGIRRILYIIPSKPKIAQIEITNRCNFNCAMCQRFSLRVPIKDMDLKIFKKIVERLVDIEELILTGWGEPLLHPNIIKMIQFAKKSGKKVSLTSNGSLLSKEMAKQLIDAHLDSISFSVDDIKAPKKGSKVHPITTQIKNIENFMQMIKEAKHKPKVIIQSTLHKGDEKNILEVIKWASSINADMVNVNRLDMRFQKLKRPNLKQERKFIQQLEIFYKKYNIITEFRPHIAFSGITRSLYKILAPFMGLNGRHCLRIYNYIYINMSGGITPCCALPLWEVGNILEDNLDDIWKNNKFSSFRKHDFQRKVCGKCDVLEVKQWA